MLDVVPGEKVVELVEAVGVLAVVVTVRRVGLIVRVLVAAHVRGGGIKSLAL